MIGSFCPVSSHWTFGNARTDHAPPAASHAAGLPDSRGGSRTSFAGSCRGASIWRVDVVEERQVSTRRGRCPKAIDTWSSKATDIARCVRNSLLAVFLILLILLGRAPRRS